MYFWGDLGVFWDIYGLRTVSRVQSERHQKRVFWGGIFGVILGYFGGLGPSVGSRVNGTKKGSLGGVFGVFLGYFGVFMG